MNHVADDRAGPDDGHFDNKVVELLRLHPRQRRHLRPRLHLKHADRVGLLQQLVDARIVLGNAGEVESGFGPRARGFGRIRNWELGVGS